MKSSVVLAFSLLIVVASAKAATHPLAKNSLATNSINCLLCKQFIQQVNGELTKPENEKAIADAIKEVCVVIYPNDEEGRLRCEVMVEQYAPSIIELFVNTYLQPEPVCTLLTLCP